ncbi:carbamoyltransferase C-terminal domain-containing protein [Actinomycetospora lutea]|uniref:carbamoyltransferase family protein n=1 Tax=Actinomycetospora lutea TaxID=663604 RepID=UPI002365C8D4|nr:carbamoyltransferase C-terminal domain-containing protein [Actinomycetospora lutea]MDD7940098.1 carbamoyltransferase C-terminal domain-containing protein [Actinomycetospora lutea]
MIVLGLSGLPHSQDHLRRSHPGISKLDERICQGLDSAAAVVVDGRLVAAASEERFTGDKGTGALPVHAIDYVLREAGVSADDVDVIAHGFDYDRHRRAFEITGAPFDEVYASATVVDGLTAAGWTRVAERFRPVRHHVAHAESALAPSGFDSALVVVSDGMGETESLSVYRATGGELEVLHTQPIATSLGILYSIATRFLGFQFNSDEYKVMGLAPYGDPERFRPVFEKLARFDADRGAVVIDWPAGALAEPEQGYPHARAFLAEAAFTPSEPDGSIQRDEADFAASLQERLTTVLVELVGHWLERTGERHLCLAGGTFLNCKSNQSIADLPGLEGMFVQPASGDDGTALGAAWSAARAEGDPVTATGPFDPYLGPQYTEDQVQAALEARPDLTWRHVGATDEYFAAAADDIADDRIIAWFSGRMEFGPRALGNRSILARPDGNRIKDRINGAVKFREAFRPFAPAVLDEDVDRLFVTHGFEPDRYMLCTAHVRPEARRTVDGIVHADDSARIQTVRPDLAPGFHRLLGKVRDRTGAGVTVNTSFNVKGQPLIMDPVTAIDTFAGIALDRLYIEGFVVEGTKA